MHTGVMRHRLRLARTVGMMCVAAGSTVLAGCTDGPTLPQAQEPTGRVAHSGSEEYCGFNEWGDCALEPITSAPGDNGCVSPATQTDYCQGSGSGATGITGGTGTWEGAGGTATGGGTGSTTPGDTVPKDSCKTGSPVFDDPVFRAGLADLWQRSNASANLAQRKEQFGWVVKTATGFRIAYLGAGNFCGYEGSVLAPPEGLSAVTGFIHTHPYAIGETILACNASMQISAQVYNGTPSDIDRATSVRLGAALGRAMPLASVIMDKNRLTVYAGTDDTGDVTQPRCGY